MKTCINVKATQATTMPNSPEDPEAIYFNMHVLSGDYTL